MGTTKAKRLNEHRGKYWGYNNAMEFATEFIPNIELKDAIKECNRNGVIVKNFCPSYSINEIDTLTLRITKSNECRVINILKALENNKLLSIILESDEQNNIVTVKILSNIFNKKEVFNVVKKSCKKKSNINELSPQLKQVYKMHLLLTKEDLDHKIGYRMGRFFHSLVISDIDSYFYYGVDRTKKILASQLWKAENDSSVWLFKYKFRTKERMLKKVMKVNTELEKEFEEQEKAFEKFCDKFRKNPNDESSDMFDRLARVRDEYEP